MIDIHSHILWGLDDGAKSLDESVEMARLAAHTGTTDIVATPHANSEYAYDPELVQRRIEELSAASGTSLRIHAGCDFHLDFDNLQDALANPRKYTINQRRYLLVEFADLLLARVSADILERLQDQGMVPIVTHPERNRYLQRHLEELTPWVERGCLVQVTAQSILGQFGNTARECAEKLIDRQLVHFVASDAHDPDHRPPRLDWVFEHLTKRYSLEFAREVCILNPQRALTGEVWPERRTPPKKRGWWRF